MLTTLRGGQFADLMGSGSGPITRIEAVLASPFCSPHCCHDFCNCDAIRFGDFGDFVSRFETYLGREGNAGARFVLERELFFLGELRARFG